MGIKITPKVDAGSKLIAGYEITDASVHDSQALDALLDKKQDKEQELYAESAYAGQQEILEKHQVKDQIHEKGYKNKPLTDTQKESNTRKSKVRVRVEHVFGFMENSRGSMYYKKSREIKSRYGHWSDESNL